MQRSKDCGEPTDYTGSSVPASMAQGRSWKKGGTTVSARVPGSL